MGQRGRLLHRTAAQRRRRHDVRGPAGPGLAADGLRVPQVRERPAAPRRQSRASTPPPAWWSCARVCTRTGERTRCPTSRRTRSPLQPSRPGRGIPAHHDHGRPRDHLVPFRASPGGVAACDHAQPAGADQPRNGGSLRHRRRRLGVHREPAGQSHREGAGDPHRRPGASSTRSTAGGIPSRTRRRPT